MTVFLRGCYPGNTGHSSLHPTRLRAGPVIGAVFIGVAALGLPAQPVSGQSVRPLAETGRSVPFHEIAANRAIQYGQSLTALTSSSGRADFKNAERSKAAGKVADWIVDSADNEGMPFVIVDKIDAKVFVFDPDGRILGSAPALLGLARGDHSSPGIGDRHLSAIRREERTTPAGRFVGSLGHNSDGSNVLWVDHGKAVSLHRVITDDPRERRLERLATPTPLDNRISYGCINVPVKFFDEVIRPVFANVRGVIYVLPEVKKNSEIFESYYDVE